nr:glycosyltransferase [Lysobacter arenosi]
MPSFIGGGAERNCVLLANELCARGLSVCFFVDRDEGPNRGLLSEAVSVHSFGETGHFGHIMRLRSALLKCRPRVIYVQIGLSPVKYLAASFLLPEATTSVVVYHGLYDKALRPGGKLNYWFAPLITGLFDSVVAVSNGLREHLVSKFGVKAGDVKVIHNPVDIDMLDRMSIAQASGPRLAQPYLVSLGRMVPQKDFATLIEAFSLIAGRVPHELVILGEGPLKGSLVEQVERLGLANRVVFPGYIENPFPIVRRADALVLSSVSEAFGNVLVEALVLGVRVVATDCPGGPREILGHGEWGWLCPPRNPQRLADAMLKALDSPADAERFRRRSMDFSVSRIADEYVAVAEKCGHARGRR